MPKFSGRDLISETTEKVIRRIIVLSTITILAKSYRVPLDHMKVFDVELPPALIDTVLLIGVTYLLYSLLIISTGLVTSLHFVSGSVKALYGPSSTQT